MVAGLKFLSKKGFNPQNLTNQKRVWEAQQEKKQEAQRLKNRKDQLQRERDDEELAKARGETLRLNFMYKPPPGLEAPEKARKQEDGEEDSKPPAGDSHATNALLERQPGDDDAAAAFRLMLAGANEADTEKSHETVGANDGSVASSHGLVLQGTSVEATEKGKHDPNKTSLSALEKAVGRRKDTGSLTLEEQVQRFPALAQAPRAKGMSATDIGVSFKPLGTQIRNVRCMACHVWGHSKGDRECKLTGWDPFSSVVRPGLDREVAAAEDEEEGHRRRSRKRDDESSSSDESSRDSRHHGRKRRKKRHKSKRRHRRHESKRHRRSRSEESSSDHQHSRRRKSHK